MKIFYSREFLKYLLTGALAALINFLSRIVFNFWFSFSAAVVLAYLTGMLSAFFLKRKYVFLRGSQSIYRSVFFFIIVNLVGFLQTWLVSMLILFYILPYFGVIKMTHEIAHGIGICAPIFTSYIGHKYLSFK